MVEPKKEQPADRRRWVHTPATCWLLETISLRISRRYAIGAETAIVHIQRLQCERDGQNRFHRELHSDARRGSQTCGHTDLSAIFLTREDSICVTQCSRQNLLVGANFFKRRARYTRLLSRAIRATRFEITLSPLLP